MINIHSISWVFASVTVELKFSRLQEHGCRDDVRVLGNRWTRRRPASYLLSPWGYATDDRRGVRLQLLNNPTWPPPCQRRPVRPRPARHRRRRSSKWPLCQPRTISIFCSKSCLSVTAALARHASFSGSRVAHTPRTRATPSASTFPWRPSRSTARKSK